MRSIPKTEVRPATARGWPAGTGHPACRYDDAVVARARALAAAGVSLRAISQQLGPHFTVVGRWVSGRLRKPPARWVMRRPTSTLATAPHESQNPGNTPGATTNETTTAETISATGASTDPPGEAPCPTSSLPTDL